MVMSVDVVIVGGGMVGSVLALALAQQNFTVAVVEQKLCGPLDLVYSPRVSAINMASWHLLENLGVLPVTRCSALTRLMVWDECSGAEIEFDSAEIALPQLGFIVENTVLLQGLQQALRAHELVTVLSDQVSSFHRNKKGVALQLTGGNTIQALLLVGADGAHSWVREQISVAVKERAYHQQAIVAVVTTEKPHQQTAWQVFLNTGPLAFLPLPDAHHCAIVWSSDNARAIALMDDMDIVEFQYELNKAFGPHLGSVAMVSERYAFPLVMRHARRYTDLSVALVGDAAHTIHPLAGQGVNLGFLDAAALLDCLVAARKKGHAIGSLRALGHYQRWRKGHNAQMIALMRLFHELFSGSSLVKKQLRGQGLSLVNRLSIIKSAMMRFAVGQQSDLPSLMLDKKIPC